MRMGLIGRKLGMTQIFDDKGSVVPITVVDASDCFITQVKTKANDGYNALQVGYGFRKPQNVSKARAGHFKKAGVPAKAKLKEIRLNDADDLSQVKAGQKLTPAMFAKGDRVDVIAVSKGKGFQGVVKRHGFHGADASHGVHEYFRHGGSNGTNTFPGRVLKLKGMPGQTGADRCTVQAIEVVEVRESENLLFLRGAVPGFKDNLVLIRSSKKTASFPERPWISA